MYIEKLNNDILLYIFNLVPLKLLLKYRLVCRNFYNNIHYFELKIYYFNILFSNLQMKYDLIEYKNEEDLLYPSSFYNSWNRIKCVNENCYYNSYKNQNYDIHNFGIHHQLAIGIVYFYYQDKLISLADKQDPSTINSESVIKNNLCEKSKNIRRFIPYCEECMKIYVNYGDSNCTIIN